MSDGRAARAALTDAPLTDTSPTFITAILSRNAPVSAAAVNEPLGEWPSATSRRRRGGRQRSGRQRSGRPPY